MLLELFAYMRHIFGHPNLACRFDPISKTNRPHVITCLFSYHGVQLVYRYPIFAAGMREIYARGTYRLIAVDIGQSGACDTDRLEYVAYNGACRIVHWHEVKCA
jgi:hypothetical protein